MSTNSEKSNDNDYPPLVKAIMSRHNISDAAMEEAQTELNRGRPAPQPRPEPMKRQRPKERREEFERKRAEVLRKARAFLAEREKSKSGDELKKEFRFEDYLDASNKDRDSV